jgi:WD40 repeat protein
MPRIYAWFPVTGTALHLWDAASGKRVHSFHEHSDAVNAAIFTPSGQILSASNDRSLCLLDAETGHRILRLRGHTAPVRSVVCSQDGKRALSSSWDHTIRLWDLETGCQL